MSTCRLTVSSGRGPVEARLFVRLLADELTRRLSDLGYTVDHAVAFGADEAPLSVDLIFEASLTHHQSLQGTHALLMSSSLRSKRDRKRWYVGVTCDAHREFEPAALDPVDLTIETCRAGGAGGQHVNRTESAVRVIHRPTGLSVRVESERSQHQNKRHALRRLAQALSAQTAQQEALCNSQRRKQAIHVERGRPVLVWRCAGDGLVQLSQ